MAFKGGGGKQQVVDYALTVHYGVCLGPVDAVKRIRIGEKDIKIAKQTSNAVIAVDNVNLFGGPKKGGGIKGRIHMFFGGDDQLMSNEIAAKYGRSPTGMTGYRGLLTLAFTALTGNTGFVWGANQPSVPAVAVTATRGSHVLDDDCFIGDDVNPAYMIYEVLTSLRFGCGYPESMMDETMFLDAGETLRDENFGLSLVWVESMSAEDFVNSVLQQISANLTFNLRSGKWELKLLRNDYDPVTLLEVNPTNAKLVSFQRKGWGETINQLTLTWTNAKNETDETVTQTDNANVAIQGSVVADSSRNYNGIRRAGLAATVCERELRQASAPLASAEVELERSFGRLGVGSVVKFKWPDLDLNTPIAMRITSIDFGERGSSKLRVGLSEDIFSFGVALTEVQDSEFEDPSIEPSDVPFYLIETAPYYLVAITISDTLAQALAYPEVRAMLLADPAGGDLREIDVLGLAASPTGGTSFQDLITIDDCFRFTLAATMAGEVTTTFTLPVGYTGTFPGPDAFMLIHDPSNQAIQEMALVTAVVGTSVTLRRGILDTVPRAWGIGAVAWFILPDRRIIDSTERAAAETVHYKMLPITSLGRLDESLATERTGTLTDRSHLPLRPANLKLDGNGIPATTAARVGDRMLTWSTRNRLTETLLVLAWDDAAAVPEAGQTTTIKIYDGVGTLLTTIAGLTGGSRALTQAELGNPANYAVRRIDAYSVIGSRNSLQTASLAVTFRGENILPKSRDFANWSFESHNPTTGGFGDGPVSGVGVGGAYKFIPDAGDTTHFIQQNFTVVNGRTYTVGAVLKAASITLATVGAFGTGLVGGATNNYTVFNLATGAVITPSPNSVSQGVVSLGGGWYYCWCSFTASGNGTARMNISGPAFTSTGVEYFLMDHAQVEDGAAPSGYYVPSP